MRITVFGTQIRLGPGFLLVFGLYAFLGSGLAAAIAFLSVLAHEAAHALMASAYDLEVESIELTPFGGVARLSGLMEQDPFVETSVAMAGPASSFLLAGIATLCWRNGVLTGLSVVSAIDHNLLLGVLNLIPVLPLDGGRVLRAQISRRLGYYRATGIVCALGRGFGIALFVSGAALALAGVVVPNMFVYGVFAHLFARKEQTRTYLNTQLLLLRRKEYLVKQGVVKTELLTATHLQRVERVSTGFSSRTYAIVRVLGSDMKPLGELTETQIVECVLSGNGDWTLEEAFLRV